MATKERVQLGAVEETLLVPLYARALDAGRRPSILNDPKAVEMVDAIEWDFERFNQRRRMAGCVLRTASFDEMVKEFLRRHPAGTVVEIGAGLNTRFERLDNGRLHWFDLDLPDTAALRSRFFTDSERRKTLAASVVDAGWIARVKESPGPYCFVAETVLVYLGEEAVKTALRQIAGNFPGAWVVLDTASQRAMEHGNRDHERQKLRARFRWACNDPKEMEGWGIGLRLVESRTMADMHESVKAKLSWRGRMIYRVVTRLLWRVMGSYRINVFEVEGGSG
ncbi:MAG TPA: class I SAM-dependent methyltransferase [Terriglobales bacterium]|nr:class I SAM-dependent methyltransferase [Terriglobales bacterium]